MRRRLGIDESARVLLAVGRNHPKKGYANLVRAAALLAERHPLLRTVIVGDGTGPLASLAQELGIEDRVLLPGRLPSHTNAVPDPDSVPHDDLVSMYMESDVFVMPSYIEGMPLVIPEAMMAGLPVIATDVAGNRDIVEHGKTGLLISPGDIEGLANAVDCLLRDHALRIRLGETAKRVAWDYDWPVIAARYESVYESALRRPTARLQAARDY
jgi:glycosyltransferase involved in cell wall biosynthesis